MISSDGFDGDAVARIDTVVEGAVEQGQVPGVVAAVARGDTVQVATAGVMAVGGAPMWRETLFRISSTTKPMTAAAVLSLADDGLLDLDAPVDRLLPELADRRVLRRPDGPLDDTVPAQHRITVRDLLTFTWGFGMQGAMFMAPEPWPIFTATLDRQLSTFGPPQPGTMPDPDTWLARLGELPLLAQPGERWLYQTGSQVLGVLASRVAGAPFEDVLRERVLGPLDMDATAFHAADTARLWTGYEHRDGHLEVSDAPHGQWSRPPAFQDGSGGLVSSVDDVVAFGRMLLRGGNPALKPPTVAEMTRDQLSPAQRANVWPGFDLLDGRGWATGCPCSMTAGTPGRAVSGRRGRTCRRRISPSSSSPSAPRTRRACRFDRGTTAGTPNDTGHEYDQHGVAGDPRTGRPMPAVPAAIVVGPRQQPRRRRHPGPASGRPRGR